MLTDNDIKTILKLFAKYDCFTELMWNTNLDFAIICSDAFWWACADAEPIESKEDIQNLKLALQDCGDSGSDGPLLYCARRRKMRPQGAMYKYIHQTNKHLFDKCGPEREVGFLNPNEPD